MPAKLKSSFVSCDFCCCFKELIYLVSAIFARLKYTLSKLYCDRIGDSDDKKIGKWPRSWSFERGPRL